LGQQQNITAHQTVRELFSSYSFPLNLLENPKLKSNELLPPFGFTRVH